MTSFSNFSRMEPETRDLVSELMLSADRQRSSFTSFVNLWMAFNGWMASVTEREIDAEMINDLSRNKRLSDAFSDLMENSPPFHDLITEFTEMWPVLNVRDVRRKLGRDAFWRYQRNEFIEACAAAKVKQQPSAWIDGDIPTWEKTLRTIYQVRCNLFHGEKSPQNTRDRQLILKSDRILRMFIRETDCFSWHDL